MRYGDDFVPAQRALKDGYGFDSYEAGLRSWIATVAIVEVGYVGEWQEYASELMARDYLNELMLRSPGSRAALEKDVRPLPDNSELTLAIQPLGGLDRLWDALRSVGVRES